MGRILVTGGAGFIGSHVAEYYAKRGEEVVVLDNLSRTEILGKVVGDPLYNWNYLKQYGNVKLVKGDIRSFEQVREAARDVDAIIHVAAQVAVTTSIANPRIDFEINALGTFNILEAARLEDASLIFTSTNKVYGENVNKIPVIERETRYEYADPKFREGIPETFPIDLTGHSPYGCSKLAADIYVQDYAHTYGLKTGVFRMSCIYGERQFGVEDQGWMSWLTIATLTGKPITIYGDGKQVRDVLYVEDLIDAFDKFLNSKLKHEVFNIGGGPKNTLSLLELLEMLKSMSGANPKVSFAEWRPADQKVYISNINKARALLNWEPKTSPEDGVKRLVNWVSNNIKLFK
jgi:CDP-paratose 2-epimerase